ncbi:MAG: hypothetical protein ABIJ09_20690 [Pseudomonadota bacterium]
MRDAGKGLTQARTEDLKKLLGALHRSQIEFPVDITGLTRVGLQHCATLLMSMLRGVDVTGARALLVCVLAERARDDKKEHRAAPQDAD